MSNERPAYSRIYWTVMDDTKFDGIREDCRLFGAWSLMLIVADMSHPSPAFLPPTVPKAAVARLVEAELVDVLPGHRYRIRGLDAERTRRSEAAKVGGLASGRSRSRGTVAEQPFNDRSTPVEQTVNIGLDEDETSTRRDEGEAPRAPDPADVYWTLTGRYPSATVLDWVDQLTAEFGPEAVIRALAKAHQQDASTQTLLGRTTDVLRSDARKLSLKGQENARQRLKERRASPREMVDPAALQAEIQKILRGEAA